MVDRYAFLDPWTQLLPQAPGSVIAVAGAGGKTTLLLRLLNHYRHQGQSVLVSQTVAHTPPFDPAARTPDSAVSVLRDSLHSEGVLVVVGEARSDGRHEGIDPNHLDELRTRLRPHVTLVEAHASTGTPLRGDAVSPVWPMSTHLAFLVGSLAAVGRPWGPATVSGIEEPAREPGQKPRRVVVDDVLAAFDGANGLLGNLPSGSVPIPFLTGFGSFRDMDGMFALVERLWRDRRVRLVCLAELLGDERRDAADLRDLPPAGDALAGERVYALYPAELDESD